MTEYEWDVEESDKHGDCVDHDHEDKLGDLLHRYRENRGQLLEGTHNVEQLVLVRSQWDDGNLLERSWAYVAAGQLPECFQDGSVIPVRYRSELEAAR